MKRAHHNPYTSHQDISLLLPWYVNKTLSGAELTRVEDHLKVCLTCRRELAGLNKLSEAIKQQSSLDSAAQSSFSQLKKRLQVAELAPDQETAPQTVIPPVSCEVAEKPGIKRWMIYPQAVALAAALLLSLLVNRYVDTDKILINDYRTLSDTTTSVASKNDIKVVFANATNQQQLNKILTSVQGQIVEGPSKQGVYTVRITDKPAANLLEILAQLRDNSNVIFAEPVYPLLSSTSAAGAKP
ncbi:MAG: zf-HC2 domain-containing protein [Methylococcaceae bacterium]